MIVHPRLIGMAFGTVMGGVIGAVWWFVWGCQVCAPGGEAFAPIVVSVIVGALAGAWVAEAPPA